MCNSFGAEMETLAKIESMLAKAEDFVQQLYASRSVTRAIPMVKVSASQRKRGRGKRAQHLTLSRVSIILGTCCLLLLLSPSLFLLFFYSPTVYHLSRSFSVCSMPKSLFWSLLHCPSLCLLVSFAVLSLSSISPAGAAAPSRTFLLQLL